jgi:outer membrane immunogenic protein
VKKFLIAAASLVVLGTPALAADMPLKAAPLPVAVYSWTSCYGGVNGGWKGGHLGESVDSPAGIATGPGGVTVPFAAGHLDLGHLNADSGAVGGQIGCRWETPTHWVFGVEGDFDWTNLNGTITATTLGTGRVFIPGDSYDNHARWESSVRGIVGRSFDKWLIYATGGLAVIDARMDGNFIATSVVPAAGGPAVLFPASAGGESKPLYGFTIGAGAAYAFAKSWDVGAEYRYSQYNGDNFNLGSVAAICFAGGTCTNTTVTGHRDLTTNEVLFKLNYHFNWTQPVVAKY